MSPDEEKAVFDLDETDLMLVRQRIQPTLAKTQKSSTTTAMVGFSFLVLLVLLGVLINPGIPWESGQTQIKSPATTTPPLYSQPGLHISSSSTNHEYATEIVVSHPNNNTKIVSELIQRATNSNDTESQEALGTIYLQGQFDVQANATLALYWFQRAAAAFNTSAHTPKASARATYGIATMYVQGTVATPQSTSLAAEYMTQAAIEGYGPAQHGLGAMYFSGEGRGQNYTLAVEWYKRAAAQNISSSQSSLGFMYLNGLGVEQQDYDAAFEWFQLAVQSSSSNAEAEGYLGFMYLKGFGVAQNDRLAVHWLELSAAQGYESSQQTLLEMYQTGRGGLRKDPSENWPKTKASPP